MIQFFDLEIENFFSIESASLDLAKPGITLIIGSVKGKGAFESNGAGKSSLVEALVWLVHGRTIRDLPTDEDVIRKGQKTATVRLGLTIDDKHFIVTRTRTKGKPVELSVIDDSGEELFMASSVIEKTKLLEKMLHYDFNTFCNTVYFPQGRFQFFTEANDVDRKKVFDQVLGTDYFQFLEKRAKELKAEARDKMLSLSTDIERSEAQIRALTEMCDGISADIKKLSEDSEETLETEQQRIEKLAERIAKREEAITELRSAAKDNANKQNVALKKEGTFRSLDRALASAEEVLATEKRHEAALIKTLEATQEKVKRYATLIEGGNCPTCKQRFVDEDTLTETMQELSTELDKAEIPVDEQRTKIKQQAAIVVESKDKLRAIDYDPVAHDDIKREGVKLETQINEKNREIAEFNTEIATIKKEQKRRAESLLGDLSSKQATLDSQTERRATAEKAVKDAKKERDRLEKRLGYLDFWTVGFSAKGLRSLIFENVLPYLNQRANHYAARLTGGDIEITINATTKLQSGESRERISVQAVNAKGASVYEGSSGGEKRRIDLAILLALQDLIASRSGAAVNIAVYDEIFDALDETGIERVVELLREMSEKRPVIIISHSAALKGFFEDVIEVRKVNGVSHLVT